MSCYSPQTLIFAELLEIPRFCPRSKETEVLWGSLMNRSHEYDAFSDRMVDSYRGGLPIFQSINYTSVDHTVRIPFAPVVRADRKKFTGTSQTVAIKYRMVSHSSSLSDARMQNNAHEVRWARKGIGGYNMEVCRWGFGGGLWMCRQQLWNVYEGPTNLSHNAHNKVCARVSTLSHLPIRIATAIGCYNRYNVEPNDSAPMNSRKKLASAARRERLI